MKYIKWGIICGDNEQTLDAYGVFGQVEGSDIVAAACRTDNPALREAVRSNDIEWCTDIQEMIESETVNAIYIGSTTSTHATYAIMAMKAGKPTYIAAPLASNYADCARINRVSGETGVPCYAAYFHRNLPYLDEIKRIITQGLIGNVVNVRLAFSCPVAGLASLPLYIPKGNRIEFDNGEECFYELASHQFDILQVLFDVIIEADGICSDDPSKSGEYPTINACFKFENGLTGSASWCFTGHVSGKEDKVRIIGDKGKLTFSVFHDSPIELITVAGTEFISPHHPSDIRLPLTKNVIEDLQGFNVCVSTGISATPDNWVLDRILAKF